jgi:hypothetical protein
MKFLFMTIIPIISELMVNSMPVVIMVMDMELEVTSTTVVELVSISKIDY